MGGRNVLLPIDDCLAVCCNLTTDCEYRAPESVLLSWGMQHLADCPTRTQLFNPVAAVRRQAREQLHLAAGFSADTGVYVDYWSNYEVEGFLNITVHDPKHVIAQRAAANVGHLELQFSGYTNREPAENCFPCFQNSPSHPSVCFTATASVCGVSPVKTPPIKGAPRLSHQSCNREVLRQHRAGK